jgi:DNA polymerase-1
VQQARTSGEVETLLGRVRQLPDINSGKFQLRSGAERIAKNTPCRAQRADLVSRKRCSIRSECCVIKNNQARLILQIHDELVFSLPKSE